MVVVSPPATIDDCGRAGRMAESEVVSKHIEEQVTEIKDIMDVDQNDAAMPQDEEHEDVFGDADDATDDELMCEPCEERDSKALTDTMKPSPSEVASHNRTHNPYRSWCSVCVRAKGKEAPHFRRKKRTKGGLPKWGMDYATLGEAEDEKDCITILVQKDEVSGALFGDRCQVKGPKDEWMGRRVLRNIESTGRRDIAVVTDGEPALVAAQVKLIDGRAGRTMPLNPPAYNPETNGVIEKGVQDFSGQLRALKIALEGRIGEKLHMHDAIMEWMIPHAGFIITRFQVGHDGKTPWERLVGKPWSRPIIEFGEQVLGKMARARQSRRPGGPKRKMMARWVEGTWVGQVPRTGEHILITKGDRAVRVRTAKRVPEDERWRADVIRSITATPRTPTRNGEDSEIKAPRAGDEAGERRPPADQRDREPAVVPQPEV